MFLEMLKYLLLLALFYAVVYWAYNYRRRAKPKGRIPAYQMKTPPRVKPKARSGPFKAPPRDRFGPLVAACMGDKGKAERLITFERKKNPGLTRDQAIVAALDRLQYDRRG